MSSLGKMELLALDDPRNRRAQQQWAALRSRAPWAVTKAEGMRFTVGGTEAMEEETAMRELDDRLDEWKEKYRED